VTPVQEAARRRAEGIVVDEAADVVRWRDEDGREHETGFHDYAGLYAVPGLYEAAYHLHLQGGAPALLVGALCDVVPPGERADLPVLDVGAGTGVVGEHLSAAGFRRVAATDLEPASAAAVLRDRPHAHVAARALDLLHPGPEDEAWLTAVAPRVVTAVAAVGFGHLPGEALHVLTRLLPPGGLLAVTVAPDLGTEPALAAHAALLLGPAYRLRHRADGVHRRTTAGGVLPATALVLERTAA
jgi:SAM-dependent methyltransferase